MPRPQLFFSLFFFFCFFFFFLLFFAFFFFFFFEIQDLQRLSAYCYVSPPPPLFLKLTMLTAQQRCDFHDRRFEFRQRVAFFI